MTHIKDIENLVGKDVMIVPGRYKNNNRCIDGVIKEINEFGFVVEFEYNDQKAIASFDLDADLILTSHNMIPLESYDHLIPEEIGWNEWFDFESRVDDGEYDKEFIIPNIVPTKSSLYVKWTDIKREISGNLWEAFIRDMRKASGMGQQMFQVVYDTAYELNNEYAGHKNKVSLYKIFYSLKQMIGNLDTVEKT
jgi:hypothetical protein